MIYISFHHPDDCKIGKKFTMNISSWLKLVLLASAVAASTIAVSVATNGNVWAITTVVATYIAIAGIVYGWRHSD
jgi:hypothetical protein